MRKLSDAEVEELSDAEVEELDDLLDEIEEYLGNRADVPFGRPNKPMELWQRLVALRGEEGR